MPEAPDAARPVGVFDSGVGGLSVLREIRRELPAEDLLYVADSGYAPYGDRDPDYVHGRATALVEFLECQGAKAVVVACNTATGVAADALRSRFTLPVIAIEPAIKPAAAATRSGVVGVLATTQTLASPRFQRLVERYASGVRVLLRACPGLVERIESGALSGGDTRAMLEGYVQPLLTQGADTLVLGCTHYPFVRAQIEELAGPGVTVLDPALPVARELRRRLEAADLLAPAGRAGTERFWTTGRVELVEPVIRQLWPAARVGHAAIPS